MPIPSRPIEFNRTHYTRLARQLGYEGNLRHKPTSFYVTYVDNRSTNSRLVAKRLRELRVPESLIPVLASSARNLLKVIFDNNLDNGGKRRTSWAQKKFERNVKRWLAKNKKNTVYEHTFAKVVATYGNNKRVQYKDFNYHSVQNNLDGLKCAVLAKIKDNLLYDAGGVEVEDVKILSTQSHSSERLKVSDMTNEARDKLRRICFEGSPLEYVGWKAPEINLGTKSCGIDICMRLFGATVEQVATILKRPVAEDSGMNANDLMSIAKATRTPLIVLDGLLEVLDRSIEVKVDNERWANRTAVVIIQQKHIYEPSAAQRSMIMHRLGMYEEEVLKDNHKHEAVERETVIHRFEDADEALAHARTLVVDVPQKHRDLKHIEMDRINAKMKAVNATVAERERYALEMEQAPTEGFTVRELKRQKAARKAYSKSILADVKEEARDVVKLLMIEKTKAQEAAKEAKASADETRHVVYVNAPNLMALYTKQLQGMICYPPKKGDDTITSFKVSKLVTIVANEHVTEDMETAKRLGQTYTGQGMMSMVSKAFEQAGEGWERSTFNAAMRDVVRSRRYGGIHWAERYIPEDDECLKACDVRRNYTSVAEGGDFYTIGFDAELATTFTYEPGNMGAYYVTCGFGTLFDGEGLYDYKMVDYGLQQGLIEEGDLKAFVKGTPAPRNDAILQGFIGGLYERLSDADCKKAVNHTIGSFGVTDEKEPSAVVVAHGQHEMQYFSNAMGKDRKLLMFRDEAGELIKIDGGTVFAVSSDRVKEKLRSDELLRNAIVQRARMVTHTYMVAMESMGFHCVRINTDAITYVSKGGKAFPVSENPQRGELRVERIGDVIMDATPEPVQHAGYAHLANEWTTSIDASDTIDYDARDLMVHNRCFISGAAGVGKTHTINRLGELFKEEGQRVLMMSFTHSAANLLDDGRTLHSALGLRMDGTICAKTLNATLAAYDVIVVDEASTIPAPAVEALCHMPASKRLYIGGDMRQFKRIVPEGASRHNLDETMTFKALCGFTRVTLHKQHRANALYANQAIAFAASGVLPDGVRTSSELEISPAISYISHTNVTRLDVNRRVLACDAEAKGVRPQPLQDRRCGDYKYKKKGCLYSMETFDRAKALHILAHKEQYMPLLFDSRSRSPAECLALLEKYVVNSMHVDGVGYKPVEYHNTGSNTRMIPTGSQGLATMTRSIRHLISAEWYIDVDMVNCHPTLAIQLCAAMNVDTQHLQEYVNRRDDVLGRLITTRFDKAYVKTMILAVLNGGMKLFNEYTAAMGEACNGWLAAFKAEIDCVHQAFKDGAGEGAYEAHLATRRSKGKWEGADLGAFFNTFLIKAEVECMEEVMRVLEGEGLLNGYALCSDGIMIRKSDKRPIDGALMELLQARVKGATGFNVAFAVKPMESALVLPEVLDTFEPKKLDMINIDLYDQFATVQVGVPVVCNKTTGLAYNNEKMVIKAIVPQGFECLLVDGKVNRVLSDKELRKLKRVTDREAATQFREDKGVAHILKKHMTEFNALRILKEAEALEGVTTGSIRGGQHYVLEGANGKQIMINQDRMMTEFEPRYCQTAFKSQGATISGRVCVLGFDAMERVQPDGEVERNGQYVVLTRVMDPSLLTLVC